MKKTRLTFFILPLFYLISLPCIGQLESAYIFQKDDTLLRKSYYDQSVQKKKNLIASLDKSNAKDYKSIYEEQFKQIGSVWQSSRTVTAPEVHGYLQSIVGRIIAANEELKGTDARVVFSRDDWPNAYSMGDGTIAFNAGLMLYLDNEAEMVFIICHELAHYYLDHSGKRIRKQVENINSDAFKKEMKRISKVEYRANEQFEKLLKTFVFDLRRHSRDNEAEADRWAFHFMKNTGYDCNAIRTSLLTLDRVDDSLLHKPIQLDQAFNFKGYPFKKKWIQKESAIFGEMKGDDSPLTEKEKDSLKTHPDCSQRIELLADSISATKVSGRKFLVDEKMFNRLKKDFFLEIMEQNYRDENLGLNLYYSIVLLERQENTALAIYSITRCLNSIYESQKNHSLGKKFDAESKTNAADYNLLLRLLARIKLDEVAALSYHFCKEHEARMKGFPGFEQEMKKAQQVHN